MTGGSGNGRTGWSCKRGCFEKKTEITADLQLVIFIRADVKHPGNDSRVLLTVLINMDRSDSSGIERCY